MTLQDNHVTSVCESCGYARFSFLSEHSYRVGGSVYHPGVSCATCDGLKYKIISVGSATEEAVQQLHDQYITDLKNTLTESL